MRRAAVTAMWLAVAVSVARAQDTPPPDAETAKVPKTSEAAEAAVAAHRAGDTKSLEEIARRERPDVWVIADLLLDRADREVALALAKAAPGPDTEKLPGYLETRKPAAEDDKRRAALKQVSELQRAGKDEEILALLAGVPPGPEDVLHVRIHQARANALSQTGKVTEALPAYESACAVAERIGWIARAASLLYNAGTTAGRHEHSKAGRPLLERAAALHERRGDVLAQARALVNLANAMHMGADWVGARPVAEKALELAERCGDEDTLLRALAMLAAVLDDRARSRALAERALPMAQRLNAREVVGNLEFNLGIQIQYIEGPAAAAPHYERALAVRRDLADLDAIAKTLRFLGEVRAKLGDMDAALAAFVESRSLYASLGSEEGLGYLEMAVGASWHGQEGASKAIEHYQKAEIHARRSGASILLARVGLQLAQADLDRGQYAKARDALLIAAAEFRRWKLVGDEAAALTNLAKCFASLNDFRGALPHAERALELAEREGAKPSIANALSVLGRLYSDLGDLPRALAALTRAVDWAGKVGNRMFEASVLLNVSAVHERRHDVVQAIRCAERARDLYEAVSAKRAIAGAHRKLGLLYYHACDYARAQAAHERALALDEAAQLSVEVGWDLVNLSSVVMDRGEYARSQALLERALGIFERANDKRNFATALGNLQILEEIVGRTGGVVATRRRTVELFEECGDERALAHALGNLADDLLEAGEVDEALALETRALELREKHDDRDGIAYSSMGLGAVQEKRGDLEDALVLFERARSLWEGLGSTSGTCNARNAVARVLQARGDIAGAAAVWESVLEDAVRIGEPWREHETLVSIAFCLLDLGRPREAITAARRSLAIGQSVLRGFSDEHAAGARKSLLRPVAAGFRSAQALDDPAEALFFLETSKAGAFLEGVGSANGLRDALLAPELREAERTAASREAAAAWTLRRARQFGDAASYEAATAESAAARDHRATVVGRIQREAKLAAGVLEPRIVGLAEVRAALRADEAFVHYALLDPHAVALVIRPDGARIVALGHVDEVREAATEFTADDGAHDPAAAIETMRALLVEPLGLDADVKRVLVSPDDVVTFTPFCALVGDRDVLFLPSATTWALLRETATARGEGVLALGDPEYRVKTPVAEPVALLRDAERLLPLPGTREEAKSVGSKVLLGVEATEGNLRAALGSRRWKAVHLACHGLIDVERPARSALAVTPTAEDDGFLTALDVFRLRVPADLVVLSACQTGRGRIARGEGVLGLTRAFMFAGAPRVLVSLWKVDDAATVALMKRFYARWNEGVAPARALREAQAFVAAQEKWKHPKYWAAWALWGLPE